MRRHVLFIGLAFLLGTGALAAATWHCLGWMTERHMAQGNLLSNASWPKMLKLTADQRAKINPLEKKLRQDLEPIQTELAMRQMTLCRLMMSSGSLDRKAVEQELKTVSRLEYRKEQRTVDHLAALRELLGPEQQKTLFSTLMTDICRGCRSSSGSKTDYCGLCKMR